MRILQITVKAVSDGVQTEIQESNPHLLVLIERGFIAAPVIEFGGARGRMVRLLIGRFIGAR